MRTKRNKSNIFNALLLKLLPLSLVIANVAYGTSSAQLPINTTFDSIEHIYHQTYTEQIWYDKAELSSSGKLLKDLAIDLNFIRAEEITQSDNHDWQLTRALLEIIALLPSESKSQSVIDFVNAVNANNLEDYLTRLIPKHILFKRYRRQINHLQAQHEVDWPKVKAVNIELGQRSPEIIKLRQRLIHSGDLIPSQLSLYRQSILDPSVTMALKSYQKRNDLLPSGILDTSTAEILNRSLASQINTLSLSLRKIFKLPKTLPNRFIWINIPSYRLTLFENQIPKLSMKVIVGKQSTPTPELTTKLPSFTINPHWRPPASIIRSELIAHHKSDPNYLSLRGFFAQSVNGEQVSLANLSTDELSSLLKSHRLIQKPGKSNALGKYRFNIINSDAIYLHDTPAKNLFYKNNRALSHGCIRLEKPALLANYLLGENHQKIEKLNHSLESEKSHRFNLAQPIDVYITDYTSIAKDKASSLAQVK